MKRLDSDLLKTARQLLRSAGERGRPRQANLRRAVSTAYYATFHALCHMCADVFTGTRQETRKAWRQVYRALEHNHAGRMCRHQGITQFPIELIRFCSAFKHLQEKREEADYDPFARFLRKDVEQLISLAESAIRQLRSVELKHRRAFAAWVLFRKPRQ